MIAVFKRIGRAAVAVRILATVAIAALAIACSPASQCWPGWQATGAVIAPGVQHTFIPAAIGDNGHPVWGEWIFHMPAVTATPQTTSQPPPVLTDHSPQAALQKLAALGSTPATAVPQYDRSEWSKGRWTDADGDCQNTRAEVLIDESWSSVTFTDGRACTVATGRWVDPWNGSVYTSARDLDVDHHVPVANAHRSGGWEWSPAKKTQYYNDLQNPDALNAMDKGDNRSKGDRGPESWKPDSGQCRYAEDWVEVKHRWSLTVTANEREALRAMLATCP